VVFSKSLRKTGKMSQSTELFPEIIKGDGDKITSCKVQILENHSLENRSVDSRAAVKCFVTIISLLIPRYFVLKKWTHRRVL
jgi:hypothetical protein